MEKTTSVPAAALASPRLDGEGLAALLTTAAGAPDRQTNEFLDTTFEDLGYDSVALLETVSLIQARWGVVLPDDVVVKSRTPRVLLALTNSALERA